MRRLGIVAEQFEGEVGLDGAAEIAGAAGEEAPATIALLNPAKVVANERQCGLILLAEDELQEYVFGFENAVALELAHPVALGLLKLQEGILGAVDGPGNGGVEVRRWAVQRRHRQHDGRRRLGG